MPDILTPLTYPYNVVRVACAKCACEGGYPRERIIARYGKDAAMPDVLRELADCPQWSTASDPCRAHFPDLVVARDRVNAMADAEAYMVRHATTFRRLGRS